MTSNQYNYHLLNNNIVLWHHSNNNNDWSIDSYNKLFFLESIEDYFIMMNKLNEKIIINEMFFFMKEGILPTWEDPKNINGGCISIKVPLKDSYNMWKILLNNMLLDKLEGNITGISITPKRNFNIIKIWIEDIIEDIKTYNFPKECDLKNKIILFRIHKTNIEKDNNKSTK
jgi:hypothetical protein